MGVASAIPGVSGGTIAVIVGIYQKLIDAINNLFKKFVSSFLTLLPIGLGETIGAKIASEDGEVYLKPIF